MLSTKDMKKATVFDHVFINVWTASTATDEPTKAPGSLANSRTFASRSERSNHLSIDGYTGEGDYRSGSKVGIINKQSKPGGTQDFSFLL